MPRERGYIIAAMAFLAVSASVYPVIGVVASATWLKAASLLRMD